MMIGNDEIWLIGLIGTHVEVRFADVEEAALDCLAVMDCVEYTEWEDV